MPSSTSSFEYPLAELPWIKLFGGAVLALAATVGLLEWKLASQGYRATVHDTQQRWLAERQRASALGQHALILIGASRIQLGVDLDILRKRTELEPVQLAIDGTSFVPVLEGLANDPRVVGTILIDYAPGVIVDANQASGTSQSYQAAFQALEAHSGGFSTAAAEAYLTTAIHENLRSYADGSNPFQALTARVPQGARSRQYLITRPDRSRLADYRIVDMPSFYYGSAARYLGMQLPADADDQGKERVLRDAISRLVPVENTKFLAGIVTIKRMVDRIQARGGHVLFVEMPTSGMVKEIGAKKYPHLAYSDLFVQRIGVPTLTADMIAARESFTCPDGSHVDFRDRARLTEVIAHFYTHAAPRSDG